MAIESYRDLEVWRLGMDLAAACYTLTAAFPREEMFGMTSQIRLPRKPKSQPDCEQNVAENVAPIIELSSTLGLQKFRTCDLAVATIKHTEDLKEHETP